MNIATVEAIPISAALQVPFRFGNVVRTKSSNVIVRISTDEGIVAYGEACPVSQLTAETQQSVVALIEERVAPQLLGKAAGSWRVLIRDIQQVLTGASFTAAAVDTALLDLAARAHDISVGELLGGRARDEIEVHGSVGWSEDPGEMCAAAQAQAAEFRVLKVYLGIDTVKKDLARLRRIREDVGPDHPFLVDVNGLWSEMDTLAAGSQLRELGVMLLEQPLPRDRRASQATVTSTFGRAHGIAVVADESVRTPGDVFDVAQNRLAHVVNIGCSKLGGVTCALDAAAVAAASGLGTMVGSVIELGIATAAGLHLASVLPALAYPSYLMGPLKYEQQITWPPVKPHSSHVEVPTGPGLGVDVDQDAIAALDLRR